MGSSRLPKLTEALLRSYSEAAFRNADELLVEASLLFDYDHHARAYFLAVACIEEAGKALLAFDAQKRNFSDPAVCTRLKTQIESHPQKITYALGTWAFKSPNLREALKLVGDLVFNLKRGREPSMYSDLRTDPDRVQTPAEVVRTNAAQGCIRLAEDILAHAHRYVSEKTPLESTDAQNRLYTMKSARLHEIMNKEDFWWYFEGRMEAGHQDLAEAVLGYERDYIKTGTLFRTAQ